MSQPICSPEESKRFEDLIRFECERAESYYQKAKSNLVPSDRPSLAAAEVMSAVYHSILAKIQKDPRIVLRSKVRLPKWEIWVQV